MRDSTLAVKKDEKWSKSADYSVDTKFDDQAACTGSMVYDTQIRDRNRMFAPYQLANDLERAPQW